MPEKVLLSNNKQKKRSVLFTDDEMDIEEVSKQPLSVSCICWKGSDPLYCL